MATIFLLHRHAGAPLGVYGCLVNSPEHGRPDGVVFHNIPLFSTVREVIPAVNDGVNIKYEFCEGKLLRHHVTNGLFFATFFGVRLGRKGFDAVPGKSGFGAGTSAWRLHIARRH